MPDFTVISSTPVWMNGAPKLWGSRHSRQNHRWIQVSTATVRETQGLYRFLKVCAAVSKSCSLFCWVKWKTTQIIITHESLYSLMVLQLLFWCIFIQWISIWYPGPTSTLDTIHSPYSDCKLCDIFPKSHFKTTKKPNVEFRIRGNILLVASYLGHARLKCGFLFSESLLDLEPLKIRGSPLGMMPAVSE